MKKISKWFFSIICIIYYSGAIVANLLEIGTSVNDKNYVEGKLVIQVISSTILIILLIILLFSGNLKRTLTLLNENIFILLLIIFAALSISWSSYPEVTLRAVISIFGTTLFAAYLLTTYPKNQLLGIFGSAFVFLLIINYIFIFIFPQRGLESGTLSGCWRGAFQQKNSLGLYQIVSIIIFYSLIKQNPKRFIWYFGVVFSFVLLIGSRSATSVIIFFILFIMTLVIKSTSGEKKPIRILLFFVFAIIIGIVSIFYGDNLFNNISTTIEVLFGKDETLSGRTIIWKLIIDYIEKRPLFGYGFWGFWMGFDGPSGEIAYLRGGVVSFAHNGYLDLLLNLGGIGLIIFVLSLIKGFRLLQMRIKNGDSFANFCVLFLFFLLLHNITETSLMTKNSLMWVLFVISVI